MATGNDPPVVRVKGFQKKTVEPAATPPSQKDAQPPAAPPVSLSRKFAAAEPIKPASIQIPGPVETPAAVEIPPEAAPPLVNVAPETQAEIAEFAVPILDEPPPAFEEPGTPLSGPRVRFQPTPVADPVRSDPSPVFAPAISSTPAGREAAPPISAALNYTPDNALDRVQRRQWWKFNLAVKAGREAPPNQTSR